MTTHPPAAAVISVCYAWILVCGVLISLAVVEMDEIENVRKGAERADARQGEADEFGAFPCGAVAMGERSDAPGGIHRGRLAGTRKVDRGCRCPHQ